MNDTHKVIHNKTAVHQVLLKSAYTFTSMQKINQDLPYSGLLNELKLLTLTHGITQITRASYLKLYQKSVKTRTKIHSSLQITCPIKLIRSKQIQTWFYTSLGYTLKCAYEVYT